MSSKLSLCLMQISSGPNKWDNLEKVKSSLQDLEEDPDLVVTPEYLMGLEDGQATEKIVRKNSEGPNSDFVEEMKEIADGTNTSLLFTTYREEGEDFYNSSIFLDDYGKILGKYDKTHLFDALGHTESDVFENGNEVTVFEWKGYKLGLAMCFDLRFPELFRIMGAMDVELILVPSGFYSGKYKSRQWRSLINSKAHENNSLVVGVNQPEPHFIGESMIASPLGYEIDRFGGEEEIKVVDIEMNEVDKSREELPLKKLLRRDLYKNYKPYDTRSE